LLGGPQFRHIPPQGFGKSPVLIPDGGKSPPCPPVHSPVPVVLRMAGTRITGAAFSVSAASDIFKLPLYVKIPSQTRETFCGIFPAVLIRTAGIHE
jgi:hypothetical protein